MQSSSESVEEVDKANKEMLKAVEDRMLKVIKEAAESAVAAIKSKVNLEPLMSALDPFDKIGELIRPFLAIFPDMNPHLYPLKEFLEGRSRLLKYKLSDGPAGIEDILDREEAWVQWRTWWTHWEYRDAVWSLYYRSWGIPELSSTAWAFRNHGFKYAKLHKKFMKKWSYTFGDYVHEGAKTATQDTWPQVIASAMVTGYTKAMEWFRPRAIAVLAAVVNDFVYRFLGTKLESFAMKILDPVISTLASAVPSPVNEVVEVEQVATEAVQDALHQMFDEIVAKGIFAPASKAWASSAYAK